MRKQAFEPLPGADSLPGLYEMLRYENAVQKSNISNLEDEAQKLRGTIDRLERRLEEQQKVIDSFTAEIRAGARA